MKDKLSDIVISIQDVGSFGMKVLYLRHRLISYF